MTDRDLRLPDWGPYGKRYAGVSHLADLSRGTRFDLSLVLGYFRGAQVVPDLLRGAPVAVMEASPGLDYFKYRYQIEGSDRVYADAAVSALSEHERLISCTFVNNTDADQRVVAHAIGSLDFARIRPHGEWLQTVTPSLPAGVHWVDAIDYAGLRFSRPRKDDGLVADGLYRGERRAHQAVGGSVLGAGFGADVDDQVSYRLHRSTADQVLRLRYRLPSGSEVVLSLEGAVTTTLTLQGTGEIDVAEVKLASGRAEDEELRVRVITPAAGLELDGFVVGAPEGAGAVEFLPDSLETAPAAETMPGGVMLAYPQLDHGYGFGWSGLDAVTTEFAGTDLDLLLRGAKYDLTGVPKTSPLARSSAPGTQHYVGLITRPVLLPARSSRTIHGVVCHGTGAEVATRLDRFADRPSQELRKHHQTTRTAMIDLGTQPDGLRHQPAQQRMIATLLTNVVFPTYTRRHQVRHFTPGRWWDCLYTWDSGFIGLGLADIDPERGADTLRAYLTEPDDPHSAYIHHGSLVPVQPYVAAELVNRAGDPTMLADHYDGLLQQYRFVAGRHPQSSTRMPSGLLNTFDHFYNSGGWDDYPAQVATHAAGMAERIGPMVTAAHAVRVAKLLILATQVLDREQDRDALEADIAEITAAVQQCWDADSGYFGYGLHDSDGRLSGILRDEEGVNLNMGLDGVAPLIAGITTGAQQQVLLDRVFGEGRLWTPIGITTVDQSAPYYSTDGYWNGSVWMAHQWFLFKTMLDLGRPELAHRIARTAVDLWTRETDRSGYCWEHFSVLTGRGGGWHQFGALSAPVVNFFASYHRPGTITPGLDTWIIGRQGVLTEDRADLSLDLLSLPGASERASLIACLPTDRSYSVDRDGGSLEIDEVGDGVLHLSWPTPTETSRHRVRIAAS